MFPWMQELAVLWGVLLSYHTLLLIEFLEAKEDPRRPSRQPDYLSTMFGLDDQGGLLLEPNRSENERCARI